MNDAIKMQISAFVDGELPQNEAELLLRRLCQDRQLRQQAAEYLSMGRIIRGERVVADMSLLRERIAAELDDSEFEDVGTDAAQTSKSFVRPVAGVAIAAAVALVALLGLQQMSVGPVTESQEAATTASAADDSYTVPDTEEDPLLDYARRHNASVQFFDTQLVTYPVPDEQPAADAQAEEDAADESADVPETLAP
jgi:anti-sigma factor RsiW